MKKELTNTDMIQQAFAALGSDADNPAVLDWVKDHHGVSLARQAVNNVRSFNKKRAARVGPAGRDRPRRGTSADPLMAEAIRFEAEPEPEPDPTEEPAAGDDGPAAFASALLALIDRWGADEVVNMAAVLTSGRGAGQ